MGGGLSLSSLGKAPLIRSLKFKRTTPGNFTRLIAPVTGSIRDNIVDPSHPLANRHPTLYANKLPAFRNNALIVRAFPKALLMIPPALRSDPPFSMAPERKEKQGGKINISLMHSLTRKVHKSSVIRSKIRNRLKTAMSLIATRGARVEVRGSEKIIVNEPDDIGSKWILNDWSYLFLPQLEIYRMPYADLIELLRRAMSKVNTDASALDKIWADMKTTTDTPQIARDVEELTIRNAHVVAKEGQKQRTKPLVQTKQDLDESPLATRSKRNSFTITKILSTPDNDSSSSEVRYLSKKEPFRPRRRSDSKDRELTPSQLLFRNRPLLPSDPEERGR